MPTEKQSAASRANSQHSTGPRTAEGRAKSRFNALKHGIFAESQIILSEKAEDLADLAAEYHERYQPAGPAERCLVDIVIDAEWRLRRMRLVETSIWKLKSDQILAYNRAMARSPDQAAPATSGEIFYGDDAKFINLQRVISACQRDLRGALKELTRATGLPACRPATAAPSDSAIDLPACRPEPAAPPAEPEQTTATSESPASFRDNSPNPPQAGPETAPNPGAEAGSASPALPNLAPDLPEAA